MKPEVTLSKPREDWCELNITFLRIPTGRIANQLATYKRRRGVEIGAAKKQIQVVVRAGLKPGTAGLRVRHADHSATLLPC